MSVWRAGEASAHDLPAGNAPRWPSDITDDGTPFEFSLAIDGEEPELRFLIEAWTPERPTVASEALGGKQRVSCASERPSPRAPGGPLVTSGSR
ncbi:MAG TPA: tryptophan dimethylallyltransferase family protein, partial [Archangium sp.]|nr:tryptophan dimethylallyltransferase family protein [Archangium sp.]